MHSFEFPGLLTVEQLSLFIQNGEGRDAFVERNIVALGDVDVFVQVPDIDVNEHEVGLKNGQVRGIVEVNIEYLAIPAPVAAEVNQEALVRRGGGFQSGGKIGFRLRRGRINLTAGRTGGSGSKGKDNRENEEVEIFHGAGNPPIAASSLPQAR